MEWCCCSGHQGSRVKSFAVSGDGRIAVTVLFDSSISVWDLEDMTVCPTCQVLSNMQFKGLQLAKKRSAMIHAKALRIPMALFR